MKHISTLLILIFMSGMLIAQNSPTVFTHKVGKCEVSVLNETQGKGNKGILIDATPEILEKTIPDGTFANAVNAYLVKTPEKNILIDAGFGTKLFDNLHSLDVAPEKIDIVLLTHMHGDHIGGLLKDGIVAFPNAKLYVSEKEHNYWTSDDEMNKQPANRRRGFESARKVIAAYKNNLQIFDPTILGDEKENLFHGVEAIAAYGHTPGHTMFLLESDNEKFLIWGDLTHAMAVQMPYPQISVTYDVDPDLAGSSRVATLKFVEQNKIPIAGMHVPYPGMGKIISDRKNGYVFTLLGK